MVKEKRTAAPTEKPTRQRKATRAIKEWWAEPEAGSPEKTLFRYRRLWASIVISTCLVSLLPLVVMAVINHYQHEKAFSEEVKTPLRLLATNARRSLQFFVDERLAALRYIARDETAEQLSDQKHLSRVFRNLKETHSGIVDIGLIDANGLQRTYVGPFALQGKNYKQQQWFQEALLQGVSVSDVFLGYRRFPHFAIAVRHFNTDGHAYLIRATFDAKILSSLLEVSPSSSRDMFVVNEQHVLQTPSRSRDILDKAPVKVPAAGDEMKISETKTANGLQMLAHAHVPRSPFTFVVIDHRMSLLGSWFSLRNTLLWFLVASVVVIVVVILVGATYSVNRIREADNKRLSVLHKVEYTAKMASIGRLAAGVAHEINNPLAIINEKAGLLNDYLGLIDTEFKHKEKFKKSVTQILNSVDRCARITRRLLRFAKHMDIRRESIRLEVLIREVLGFLEKEANHRELEISIDIQDDVPVIESDRGRLQQVFLNLVNNAFGAVEDGGRINIFIAREGDNHVSVTIRDNGEGIPEEHLPHIFEPFFTTKEKHGTGLGLSITYGIVEKLGGKITVDSEVGEWTKFAVTLPVNPEVVGGGKDGNSRTAGR